MSIYSAPEDWVETEDMAEYAIAQWRDSGHRTHWEYRNRHGVELCCKVSTADRSPIGGVPCYTVHWLIDRENVSRRRFVECWHDMKIRDIFASRKQTA